MAGNEIAKVPSICKDVVQPEDVVDHGEGPNTPEQIVLWIFTLSQRSLLLWQTKETIFSNRLLVLRAASCSQAQDALTLVVEVRADEQCIKVESVAKKPRTARDIPGRVWECCFPRKCVSKLTKSSLPTIVATLREPAFMAIRREMGEVPGACKEPLHGIEFQGLVAEAEPDSVE